jgi:glycosyltransferase involved in cell wall biosynthesis
MAAMPEPLVSVIMGTYKRADIIGRAIDSVRAQDFADWELIVVGCCTPDNTGEVVARYNDPRIRFHNLDQYVNDSGSATKNYGIRNMARGKYIAYLDDDDLYTSDHLSVLVGYMERHPDAALAYCRSCYRDKKTGRKIFGNPFQRWMHGYSREKLQRYNFLNVNCVIHTKALLDEVGYWRSDKFFNDYDLWLRVSEKHDLHHVNKVLVETFVTEPPFLERLFTKGVNILKHGRRTPRS